MEYWCSIRPNPRSPTCDGTRVLILPHSTTSTFRQGSTFPGASMQTALGDRKANFADARGQGPRADADQMLIDDASLGAPETLADSILAVTRFCDALLPAG